ncbi:MAG: metallophosphoesterase [Planctomycetaceae bacterium]
MRIGIVSDTHGHLAFTRQAIEALRRHPVETVIHCGDIGGPDIVDLFDQWPTHFVFGNVDHYLEGALAKSITLAGQTCHGEFGSVELDGKRIAFLHSDDQFRFRSTIKSQEWDLVCYGHTHVAEHHVEGRTLVLNPGAIYRANPRSIAIVTLPELEIEFVNLD